MNNRKILPLFLLLISVVATVLIISCNSNTTAPANTGPGGGGSNSFGSGTVSMTLTGKDSGMFVFSGPGTWPPGPSGVAAGMDSTHRALNVVGYSRTTLGVATASKYTFVALILSDSSGLSAKSYSNATIEIGINIDTAKIDSQGYIVSSGSVVIDTIVGNHVALHFSGSAKRLSDSGTVNVTNGHMTVTAKTGLFLSAAPTGGSGGGGGGNTGGKSGSGSYSFSSDRGNFSASGAWDTSVAAQPSQVGAWRDSSSGKDDFSIYAVNYLSSTSADVSILIFKKSAGALDTGQYTFPSQATFGYGANINPTDTAALLSAYILSTGSVSVDSLKDSTTSGTFSGTGFQYSNITRTISVSNGKFSVHYVHGIPGTSSQLSIQSELLARRVAARLLKR